MDRTSEERPDKVIGLINTFADLGRDSFGLSESSSENAGQIWSVSFNSLSSGNFELVVILD